MGERPHNCCDRRKVKRGLWSPQEDEKLINYITRYGHGTWSAIARLSGLERCGKSCRLRWINYLRPDLKKGSFNPQEASSIIELHRMLGNKWAKIVKHLPGRTDNEVKNFWNSNIKKRIISSQLQSKAKLSYAPKYTPMNQMKSSTSSCYIPHHPSNHTLLNQQVVIDDDDDDDIDQDIASVYFSYDAEQPVSVDQIFKPRNDKEETSNVNDTAMVNYRDEQKNMSLSSYIQDSSFSDALVPVFPVDHYGTFTAPLHPINPPMVADSASLKEFQCYHHLFVNGLQFA